MDAIGPSAARTRESIFATIPALLFRRHPGFGSYGIAWNGGFLLVCGRHHSNFHRWAVSLFSSSGLGSFLRFGGSPGVVPWLASPKLLLLSEDVGQHRQT